MDRPLHPNLARIASAYDQVMYEYRSGVLSPAEARRRTMTLVARDDNGLEWSIDPDTGSWRYRNQFGEMITANPPAYGVASFTPADLGGGTDDDARVRLYEVDQGALHNGNQLRGSTMLALPEAGGAKTVLRRASPIVLLLAGAGGTILLLRLLGAL
jgi:hypothetical protein